LTEFLIFQTAVFKFVVIADIV